MLRFSLVFRKYILLWSILSMLIGYFSGRFNPQRAISLAEITIPLLFIMILIMIIPANLSNIFKIKKYLLPTGVGVLIFIISPFIAYTTSSFIPKNFIFLNIGIIIVSTAPPDAMLSAWAGFLEADILLTLILQSINFFLWILLLPLGLSLILKGIQSFSPVLLIKNLVLLIVIPFIIAFIIRTIFKNKLSEKTRKNIRVSLSTISGMIELFIITITIALNSRVIARNPVIILWGVLSAALYYSVTFLISLFTTSVFKIGYEKSIPVIYENVTKNLPLAMTVAISTFNEQAILGVAACMLVQFPISALFFNIIMYISKKQENQLNKV